VYAFPDAARALTGRCARLASPARRSSEEGIAVGEAPEAGDDVVVAPRVLQHLRMARPPRRERSEE